MHPGWERYSELSTLTHRILYCARTVDFANGAPQQPFEKIHVNDIDFGNDYCLADSNISDQEKASRTLCGIVAISESDPSTPADWDEYAVDEDLQEAMYQAANEFQAADGGTGVMSNNNTVVWHSSYIDAIYPIDGSISCAAHFRCYLPIAAVPYLCAIHTEHAARSISANLLESVLPWTPDWHLPVDHDNIERLKQLRHLTNPEIGGRFFLADSEFSLSKSCALSIFEM
jgi:hypothetical protein